MNLKMNPGQTVNGAHDETHGSCECCKVKYGAELDVESKNDMIVTSLNESFDQFELDYLLNNKQYSMQGLILQDILLTDKTLGKNKKAEAYSAKRMYVV
ncbi:hypothetical protein TorRG33x02_308570 [Trema orientale]|uniref:Uncharacterized protein n=1 Tax=Trema orientale TaxID=63057 RepID=A0A2P5BU46_TREOI|nr:hypothetical protein TorRG33x02_308570 [Trema orientale]